MTDITVAERNILRNLFANGVIFISRNTGDTQARLWKSKPCGFWDFGWYYCAKGSLGIASDGALPAGIFFPSLREGLIWDVKEILEEDGLR